MSIISLIITTFLYVSVQLDYMKWHDWCFQQVPALCNAEKENLNPNEAFPQCHYQMVSTGMCVGFAFSNKTEYTGHMYAINGIICISFDWFALYCLYML